MNKVAIVADSVSCIPIEEIERYGIKIVPTSIIRFEGREYKELVDISISEAYELLERSSGQFGTSAISPADFREVFQELSTQAENIFCITLSSKLSAVYHMALLARDQVITEFPGKTIEVLDSRTAAAAEGLVVLAAARAASKGKSLPEVIEVAERVRERVQLVAVMDTIRYVYRTGRIPKIVANLGSMLNIKPVFTISDGAVHHVNLVRSKQRGIDRIVNIMKDKVGADPVHVAVMHADIPHAGRELMARVTSEFNCIDIILTEFSPVMGYATGRGVLGLAFYGEDR